MLSRSTINQSIARKFSLQSVARLAVCTLAMFTCSRCALFGGIQAAAAALFAAGMCAGWNCGGMLLGCALGCATMWRMDSVWPAFACLSIWLVLCVAGSVELAPYPSRNGFARLARRICMIARGKSGDAARVALAAGAAGMSNLIMTLVLAGISHSSLIYCAVSALLGFGLTPAFAIGLGSLEAPANWRIPARALLAGVCVAGLLGFELGALEVGNIGAAFALAALARSEQRATGWGSCVNGMIAGGLIGMCIWLVGGDWIQALGYAAAGGLLSGLGGIAGLAAGWAMLTVAGAARGIALASQYLQSVDNALSAFELFKPALFSGINAFMGLAVGAALSARIGRSAYSHAIQMLLERCLAQERARIDRQAAQLTSDLNDILSAKQCPNKDESDARALPIQQADDAQRVELMRRISRLAADAATRRRVALERQRADVATSRKVMARLTGYGIECEGVCVTADVPRRAYVVLKTEPQLHDTPESIERALTYVTGVRFEYESNAQGDMLVLRQCGALAVRGAVRRSACGRTECGDNAVLTRLSDGRYLAGLSDGMGRGEPAAKESYAALAAVEQLLDCGITPGQALDAVNELLMLSGDGEMYATLDIALIDPSNGRADMYKLGALPSVLLSGGQARLLGAYAPPFGILERVRAAQRTVRLRAGDRLALLSDGVCDFSVEAQTRALAASARTLASVPPGDAAEMLLGRMRRRFGSTDDAAVVLIDVARRDTAWHGALFGRKFSAAH